MATRDDTDMLVTCYPFRVLGQAPKRFIGSRGRAASNLLRGLLVGGCLAQGSTFGHPLLGHGLAHGLQRVTRLGAAGSAFPER